MKWLVIPCVTPHRDGEDLLNNVALVKADTPEEAASLGRAVIERESSEDPDPDYMGSMFAVPVEAGKVVAMRAERVVYERADDEFQCCAGPIPSTDNGHSGFCPHAEPDTATDS